MATRYRVTAPTKVFGVTPGNTFTRDLDPVTESRLIQSGAIKKVGGKAPAPKPAPTAPAETKAETAETKE